MSAANHLSGQSSGHFDEMTALLYLDKQLEAERDQEVVEHVSTCGSCRELLQALQRENIWLQEALAGEEALPAKLREAPDYAEALPLEHPEPSQLDRLQAEHASKEVRGGLAKLPDRARMALVLRYYADMSYDEIAETLGVRRAFVGVLLLRARHQLRDILRQSGADAAFAAGGNP